MLGQRILTLRKELIKKSSNGTIEAYVGHIEAYDKIIRYDIHNYEDICFQKKIIKEGELIHRAINLCRE